MSLFGKLFGKRTLEEEQAHADALFEAQEFGEAKLGYERAQDLARERPDVASAMAARVDACRDAIARRRIEEAERLLAQGDNDIAREELTGALQTAASRELLDDIDRRLMRLARNEPRVGEEHGAPPDDSDRFEVIAGGFEEDQYAEYIAHGEAMKAALLAFHDGKIKEARAAFEALAAHADGPRYLWFELGRARLADGDPQAGAEALTKFLASLHAEEGGDSRLLAHMELAQLVHSQGDFDGAITHYEQALESMPDDPRPYLAMANFLRREKQYDEAIEVLEAALGSRDESSPDHRLWHELGLAYAEAGRDADAIAQLERVIDHLARRQVRDLPPEGTLRLAQLYEKSDRPARALDLYTLLADGGDRQTAFAFRLEAARLMQKLGLTAEARRAVERARDEAPPDEAVRARVEEVSRTLLSEPSSSA